MGGAEDTRQDTLVLISAVKSVQVRLQLNNLKHLLLKLNWDNSGKRLRSHHGLFSEIITSMCSSSQHDKKMLSIVRKDFENKAEGCVLPL